MAFGSCFTAACSVPAAHDRPNVKFALLHCKCRTGRQLCAGLGSGNPLPLLKCPLSTVNPNVQNPNRLYMRPLSCNTLRIPNPFNIRRCFQDDGAPTHACELQSTLWTVNRAILRVDIGQYTQTIFRALLWTPCIASMSFWLTRNIHRISYVCAMSSKQDREVIFAAWLRISPDSPVAWLRDSPLGCRAVRKSSSSD